MAESVPSPADVIPRSMVPERVWVPVGLTAEQELARQTAQRLRTEYQRVKAEPDGDPLAPLRSIAERKPLGVNVNAELGRRFGTEATSADPRFGTEFRLDAAKDIVSLGKNLSENGFESIVDRNKRNNLIDRIVAGALDNRPAFQNLTPDEKASIAEEILKHPDYQSKLGEVLTGHLKPDEVISQEGVEEAKAKLDQAEKNYADKNTEYQQTVVDQAVTKGGLSRFEPKPDGSKGDKQERLENLEQQEAEMADKAIDMLADIRDIVGERDMDKLQGDVKRKVEAGETLDPGKEAKMGDFLSLDREVKYARKMLGDLRSERGELTQKLAELNGRLAALPDEVRQLQVERDGADNAFRSAANAKAVQEMTLLGKLNTMFQEAGNKVLEAEIVQRNEVYQKWQHEQAKIANDADGEKVTKAMESRWDRIDPKSKAPKIKEKVVDRDYETMLLRGGPKEILRETLMRGLEDDPFDTPEEAAQKARERTRIEQRLATDKEFVNKHSALIAERVITKKMQTSKLYEGDVRVLSERGWGEAAIDGAISRNEKLRERLDKMFGVPGAKPNYVERMKRVAGGNWLKLLLLLFGGAFASSALVNRYAAQEGVRAA